ncbi:dTDP-4-dehydrorhamnose reductase [Anoxybacter fermentans]|uniref:dTDP-4-dehydrorhamnose reductase n=1 Tax=Anoxybacter fermentans TaxID=1323375 RepID=A0A3S9SUQ8_9FIRM|nr:dTDP-4-dehydrorhamnose reductase [Anoxybacter fermentans]AZR72014.1 dTDP-4-dehydrorhamnose reductase [Anoxybacter fermentans]
MKVLITGSRGQLGRALSEILQKNYDVYAWGRRDLDFTDHLTTFKKVTKLNPDLIIHCGAFTDVKGCELDPEKAYLVNGIGTRNIVVAARECDSRVVYISTDYVFDGEKKQPYIEFDPPNPINVYGRSKLAGEEIIQSILQKYFIIRTSWLFSEDGNNFVKTMIKLACEQKMLSVVCDQIGTPTYVKDLAIAIKEIIKKPFYGIYHVSNNGSCSWYEFAKTIFEIKGMDINLRPVTSKEYGGIVKRPVYSVLKNFNLEETYGFVMRDWKYALLDCMNKINL